MSGLIALLLTPEVLGIVGAAALWLIGKWFGAKKGKAERNFELGVRLAYNIVYEVSKRTENKIDDKAALALKHLRDFLSGRGQTLKPKDEAEARLIWKSMHGEELAKKDGVK